MSDQEFDEVYTRLCHALTGVGMDGTPAVLARLTLLLMTQVNDAPAIHHAIDAALEQQGAAA